MVCSFVIVDDVIYLFYKAGFDTVICSSKRLNLDRISLGIFATAARDFRGRRVE
tara:strand:- start:41915 stop:42076 length:162 start_codon:yes stop_codon:yes gene_type:complete